MGQPLFDIHFPAVPQPSTNLGVRGRIRPFRLPNGQLPLDNQITFTSRIINNAFSGRDSAVMVGTIGTRTYIIKIFRFYHHPAHFDDVTRANPQLVANTPVLRQTTESDPFYKECRAYGRLQAIGKEKLAVKCHGYLYLGQAQENDLFQTYGLDHVFWRQFGPFSQDPLRAIIKEYLPGPNRWTPRMIVPMKRTIINLHKAGITEMHIDRENYVGSVIVDFGMCSTIPKWDISQGPMAPNGIPAHPAGTAAMTDRTEFDLLVHDFFANVNTTRTKLEDKHLFYVPEGLRQRLRRPARALADCYYSPDTYRGPL